MKPTFLALTALGAIVAATPALAQGYGSGYQGNNDRYYNNYGTNRGTAYGYDDRNAGLSVDARIARLDAELNAGIRAGTIDRDEAAQLRAELRELRDTNRRYGYGGLSASERSDLMERLQSIGDDIRGAEGGTGYGSGYGNGYSGSYGTTGTYSGYGSNGYGSGYRGTYNNGYSGSTGSGGSYGNGYSGSTGYGSTYGNGYSGSTGYSGTYGNGYSSGGSSYSSRSGAYDEDSGYGLRVGARATGNLYAVPTELRNTYRDGYGYYYRSDGNAIYQIDSRSGTVLRVYPMNR